MVRPCYGRGRAATPEHTHARWPGATRTHTLALALVAAALGVAAQIAHKRRSGWPAFARSVAEWTWSAALTCLLVEVGATVLGLGVAADEAFEHPAHQVPEVITVSGVAVPEDYVRERTSTPVVVFVGDLFTAGQGVHTGEGLPEQVREALARRGVAIDERNGGDCGDSFETKAIRHAALYANVDPDVVVWVFVLNDFGIREFAGSDDLIVDRRVEDRTGIRAIDALRQIRKNRRLTEATLRGYREALPPLCRAQRQPSASCCRCPDRLGPSYAPPAHSAT